MSRNYTAHSNNFKTITGLNNSNSFQGVDTSLLPGVDNTYDIGSASLRWQDVFATRVIALGGGLSEFSNIEVKNSLETVDLNVTEDAYLSAGSILYTNKIRSSPTGGTVTVYDNLNVLGVLTYAVPPAATGVFGTLSDTEIGDLVKDPLDAVPPEAANSNLQPAAERILSAPCINATQWISTPFITLMGLAQTDKLKVTSNLAPANATDYNNTAFWNEGGAILDGRTYINDDMVVSGSSTLTGGISNAFQFTGSSGLPAQNNTGNAYFIGGQGALNTGRVVIGDGTGWQYRFSNRISSTTTDVATVQDNGKTTWGIPNSESHANWSSLETSFMTVRSVHPHTSGNHSGTLAVVDTTNIEGSAGGAGGSIVFAGPYTDFGTNTLGAAGRIRGQTTSGAFGGELVFETVDGGGGMNVGASLKNSLDFEIVGGVKCARVGAATSPTAGPNTFAGGIAVNNTSHISALQTVNSLATGDSTSTTAGPNTFAGGLAVDGRSVMNGIRIPGNRGTVYGWNVAGKETNAGLVGYGALSGGTSQLDIVGAGTTAGNRSVKIWDNLVVGGLTTETTGAATSSTAGPNKFAGGLAVNNSSFFTTLNCDTLTADTSFESVRFNALTIIGGFYGANLDVNNAYIRTKLDSTVTGAATSTTVGPNKFAGGLSVNDKSVLKSATIIQGEILELGGQMFPAKQTFAGNIQYGGTGTFNQELVIYGGAASGFDRIIKLYDNVELPAPSGTFKVAGPSTLNLTNIRSISGNWPAASASAGVTFVGEVRALGGQNQTWNANDCLPGTILERTSITTGCLDKIPGHNAIMAAFGTNTPVVGSTWETTVTLSPNISNAIWYVEGVDSTTVVYPRWFETGVLRNPSVRGYSCMRFQFIRRDSSTINVFMLGQAGALGNPDQ